MKKLFQILMVLTFAAAASSALAEDDVVMKAMKDELGRSMQQLHLPNVEKPYFIAYRVTDDDVTVVSASLGNLTTSNNEKDRTLHVDVRVGDYTSDNSNFLSRSAFRFGGATGPSALPLDNDYDEIRRIIWIATDAAYNTSSEALSSKRALMKNRNGGSSLPDFTRQDAFTLIQPPVPSKADKAAMEKMARELSAVFKQYPEITESSVTILVRNQYTRYVNSEGSVFTKVIPLVTVNVRASSQASDGLPLHETFDVIGRSTESFNDHLLPRTQKLAARLKALRSATTIERYNGPVLFENQAAAEAFAQVFAPALIASRFPVSDQAEFESGLQQFLNQLNGPPLSDRMGGRVLPSGFDVVDNPKLTTFDGTALVGATAVDDEAVPTRELTIVDKGILKTMFGTRTPSNEVKAPTGSRHGLSASPSNLFLNTERGISNEELHKKLLEVVKDRGLEYGIVVRDVGPIGLSWLARMGTAVASRELGNAGEVEAYKVYLDGHEEPVRNLEFAPFMASGFKEIMAAGNKPAVYSGPFIPTVDLVLAGMGGGGMGGDPFTFVSYVAPSLLFEEVALKKSHGPSPNPPVVPSPMAAGK